MIILYSAVSALCAQKRRAQFVHYTPGKGQGSNGFTIHHAPAFLRATKCTCVYATLNSATVRPPTRAARSTHTLATTVVHGTTRGRAVAWPAVRGAKLAPPSVRSGASAPLEIAARDHISKTTARDHISETTARDHISDVAARDHSSSCSAHAHSSRAMRLGSTALLASFLPVRGEVPNCARYFSAGWRSYVCPSESTTGSRMIL